MNMMVVVMLGSEDHRSVPLDSVPSQDCFVSITFPRGFHFTPEVAVAGLDNVCLSCELSWGGQWKPYTLRHAPGSGVCAQGVCECMVYVGCLCGCVVYVDGVYVCGIYGWYMCTVCVCVCICIVYVGNVWVVCE